MNCPNSEHLAAHAEGRLDAAESALLLEHCSECDACRRELALLELARGSSQPAVPVPSRVRKRARRAVLRLVERDRTTRRLPVIVRGNAPGWAYAAAALVIAVAGLLAWVRWRDLAAPEPSSTAARPGPERDDVAATPAEPQEPIVTPGPEESPGRSRDPRAQRVNTPREDSPRPEPGPVAQAPEPVPSEAEPSPAPARPSHRLETRALAAVQVTDAHGSLTVRRQGGREKERVSGVTRLGEGDVLAAEKPSSLHLEGGHSLVLGENSSISLAYVPQEQAPYLQVHSGQAVVDSTGPTRWIVSDGRVSVAVNRTLARFAAYPRGDRLALLALSEPLYVRPDGGRVHAVRAGEELAVGGSAADVARLDAASVQRTAGLYAAARPRQRTIFYTSCDLSDAQRGHAFLQDGSYFKNEAILSRERPGGRACAATLSMNPRVPWRENLLVRFRFSTNATVLQVSLRMEEKKVTFVRNVTLDRRSANQWLTAEIPLGAFAGRRDDGASRQPFTGLDKLDWIRFGAQQQDVFGDQKVYFLIDDLQVVEKE